MEILSLIMILIILVIVIIFVTLPLFKVNSGEEFSAPEGETSQVEYQEILSRIRELDFEYSLGKIAEEDYQTQRYGLKNQAADLLQSINDQNTPDSTQQEQGPKSG